MASLAVGVADEAAAVGSEGASGTVLSAGASKQNGRGFTADTVEGVDTSSAVGRTGLTG